MAVGRRNGRVINVRLHDFREQLAWTIDVVIPPRAAINTIIGRLARGGPPPRHQRRTFTTASLTFSNTLSVRNARTTGGRRSRTD